MSDDSVSSKSAIRESLRGSELLSFTFLFLFLLFFLFLLCLCELGSCDGLILLVVGGEADGEDGEKPMSGLNVSGRLRLLDLERPGVSVVWDTVPFPRLTELSGSDSG